MENNNYPCAGGILLHIKTGTLKIPVSVSK